MGRVFSRAVRVDNTQAGITRELRAGGALVQVIHDPVDLVVSKFELLVYADCKTFDSKLGGVKIPSKQHDVLKNIHEHRAPFVFLCDEGDARELVRSKRSWLEMCKLGQRHLAELLRTIAESKKAAPKWWFVKVRRVGGVVRFGDAEAVDK